MPMVRDHLLNSNHDVLTERTHQDIFHDIMARETSRVSNEEIQHLTRVSELFDGF